MAALKAIRVFIVRNYSVTEEVKTISNYIVNAEICGLFSNRYTVCHHKRFFYELLLNLIITLVVKYTTHFLNSY